MLLYSSGVPGLAAPPPLGQSIPYIGMPSTYLLFSGSVAVYSATRLNHGSSSMPAGRGGGPVQAPVEHEHVVGGAGERGVVVHRGAAAHDVVVLGGDDGGEFVALGVQAFGERGDEFGERFALGRRGALEVDLDALVAVARAERGELFDRVLAALGSLRIWFSSVGFWQFRRGITAIWRASAQPVTSGSSLPVTAPPAPQLK